MAETPNFYDVQLAVYRGSRAIEIVPGPENTVSPRKWPEMVETTSFDDVQMAVSRAIEIIPGPKNSVL